MTVDKWRPRLDAYEPSLVEAVEQCARFVESIRIGAKPYWLTLSGVTGCGKTLLAYQTHARAKLHNPHAAGPWIHSGREASDWTRRPECLWLRATDFADLVRGDFALPDRLGGDFLVGIDDVGAAHDPNKFLADAIYRLCNARLGKWALFTTNLSLGEVARAVDERVASRMIRDGNVAHRITAGDYALRARR